MVSSGFWRSRACLYCIAFSYEEDVDMPSVHGKKRILTFNVLQIDVRLAVRLDFTMSFCEECDVRLWVSPEPPYLSARQPRYPGSNMEVIVLLLRPE